MLFEVYKREVELRGKTFINDAETRNNLLKASKWLTDPNTKSSLLIMGVLGNGKSTLLKSMQILISILYANEKDSFKKVLRSIKANDLAKIVQNDAQFTELKQCDLLAIDDIGIEPSDVKVYGNVYSPLVELIYARYDAQKFTVMTTNLTEDELFNKYGARISDRFAEMCDQIAYEQGSYRIEKPKTK